MTQKHVDRSAVLIRSQIRMPTIPSVINIALIHRDCTVNVTCLARERGHPKTQPGLSNFSFNSFCVLTLNLNQKETLSSRQRLVYYRQNYQLIRCKTLQHLFLS